MCNSMHIVSQQRWLTEPLCRATSRDQQGFEGHGGRQEFRWTRLILYRQMPLHSDSSYSGYFSETALTSNMGPSVFKKCTLLILRDRHHADAVRIGTVPSLLILLWTSGNGPGSTNFE